MTFSECLNFKSQFFFLKLCLIFVDPMPKVFGELNKFEWFRIQVLKKIKVILDPFSPIVKCGLISEGSFLKNSLILHIVFVIETKLKRASEVKPPLLNFPPPQIYKSLWYNGRIWMALYSGKEKVENTI